MANEEGLHPYLGKLSPPQPDKFSGLADEHVATFIRGVDRYFQLMPTIPEDKQALWATSWLKEEPLRLWEAEMQMNCYAKQPCPFQPFKGLLKHNDTLLPAREFKQ